MRITKKLISTALSLAFMAGTIAVPGLGNVALAAEQSDLAIKTAISKGDFVYLGSTTATASYDGTKTGEAIKWRVLDSQKTNAGTDGMFLITEDCLGASSEFGNIYFDSTSRYSNVWKGSEAQGWCTDFATEALSEAENNAVLAVSKSDDAYTYNAKPDTGNEYDYTINYGTSALENEKVFFLSAEEAKENFTDWKARVAKYNSSSGYWWLRSPNAIVTSYAGIVDFGGRIDIYYVNCNYAARPALNINLESVIFTSAAEGGKSSGTEGAGAIIANTPYTGNEWKLTLKDPDRSGFKVEAATDNGNGTITIPYSGAKTGTNEYISGIVKDDSGNITGYGQILKLSSGKESGSVKVKKPASGTLYIFNEQCNGDKKTDYASEPVKVEVASYMAVTDITGVATAATAGTDLELKGTIAPADATNKTIVWSLTDASTTGATISGNILKTTAAGTVKVTATIKNGKTETTDFTKVFEIAVARSAEQIQAEEKAAADKAAADVVIKAINDLGVVIKADEATKTKIDKIKAEYDKLTDDQKKLVTNYNVFVYAQNSYTELAKNAPATTPSTKPIEKPGEIVIKGITYKVTSADAKTAAVASADKTIKSASIKSTVKIGKETYKVTSIAKNAFKGCAKLTKVSGGSNIETIGSGAFSGCKALKSFSITSKTLKSIGSSAFKGDKKLKTIKLTKTTKLTKKGVKNALKGSSVKTVDVGKKQVKSFKKFFAKSNSGVKVTLK